MDVEAELRDMFSRESEIVAYRELPPFNTSTVDVWWRQAVKPHLEKPETLEQLRGTPFYKTLLDGARSSKDYDLRDELKRRCKPRLKALAPPVSSKPPPVHTTG